MGMKNNERRNDNPVLRRAAMAKYRAPDPDPLGTTLYRLQHGLPLTDEQKELAKYFEEEK